MKTSHPMLAAGLLFVLAAAGRAFSPMPIPDSTHTALHVAAENGDAKKVNELIRAMRSRDRKVELNRLDREGYSPLAYAARVGSIESVRLLVAAGAEVDRLDDYGGWTPLLHAASGGHAAVVRYLLEQGANPNATTRLGYTPLSVALHGSFFSAAAPGDRDATVRALLAKGADPALLLDAFDKTSAEPAETPARADFVGERRQLVYRIHELEEESRRLNETIARMQAAAGDHSSRPSGN
jgi:ankyrin repeat protein